MTPVADAVRDAAQPAGIDLHDFLRVEDGRHWSYRCGDEACCPAAGVLFDATAHCAAARHGRCRETRARRPGRGGRPRRADRRDAAESMRHATRRAEQHAAQLLAKVRRSSRIGAARHMIAAEGLAAVGQMIARYGGGGGSPRTTVARLRWPAGPEGQDAPGPDGSAHTDAHLRLWIDVVRRAQPGHVAAPAALIALASSR